MKRSILVALTSFLFYASLANGADLVQVNARKIFVPAGFDDNDEVVTVLDGYLPNGCYKLAEAQVEQNVASGEILVRQLARVTEGPCLKALVPFTSEVRIGVLPAGNFKVKTNNGLLIKSVTVAESTNAGPDDFLYAPVDSIDVTRSIEDLALISATIKGRFTNGCMRWKEAKIIDSGESVEILPMVEMIDEMECEDSEVPYQRTFTLPRKTPGRYLIHVRSLNGKAVNEVYSSYQ